MGSAVQRLNPGALVFSVAFCTLSPVLLIPATKHPMRVVLRKSWDGEEATVLIKGGDV
jgi:hypothetical protein